MGSHREVEQMRTDTKLQRVLALFIVILPTVILVMTAIACNSKSAVVFSFEYPIVGMVVAIARNGFAPPGWKLIDSIIFGAWWPVSFVLWGLHAAFKGVVMLIAWILEGN